MLLAMFLAGLYHGCRMVRPEGSSVPPRPRSAVAGPSPRGGFCRLGAGLIAALLVAPPSPLVGVAAAQSSKREAASRDQQAAELFRQARDLLDQGNHQQACELFERSLELKMSPGILLNLGNCYERDGDLLRSVATFERAIIEAQTERDAGKRKKWLDAATQRRAAVLELLPTVAIKASPTPDVRITLDGNVPEQLGGVVRANPGRHRLEAAADGKQTHVYDFELAPGQKLDIELPALVEPPRAAPLPASTAPVETAAAPSPEVKRETSILPWVLIGAGAGVGALGIATALVAKSKESELDRSCNPLMAGTRTCDDPALESVKSSGENWALATYVAWGAAAVSLGIGVTLLATGAGDSESTTLSAGCFGDHCGLSASGSF